MRNLPAPDDIDNDSVFVVSCSESVSTKNHPPSVGDVEIEGTKTLDLIHTGATLNIMDMLTYECKDISIWKHNTASPNRSYRRHSSNWHKENKNDIPYSGRKDRNDTGV